MVEPAKFDERRTPSIIWNEQRWPVPPLVADQLDMIWDDVHMLTHALEEQERDARLLPETDALKAMTEERRRELAVGKVLADRVFMLTGEQYKAMREVVHYGLTRAHPDLTRDEFRSVPTTPFEMLIAFYVVRRQSQIYGPATGDDPPGEAVAMES